MSSAKKRIVEILKAMVGPYQRAEGDCKKTAGQGGNPALYQAHLGMIQLHAATKFECAKVVVQSMQRILEVGVELYQID